ncbi:suppressor of cytokine signaling 6 isoform X1 [Microplitis mediator]|uniref:suppressor of cytokine signaling 6 isoform X1 n=1 Tax=Microplitis mediator TaxID=375433 RepID=UPI0025576ED2|nr:suppressor of cytokine signaling 6 isoform X1 [Microplitis mediator]XP_057321738.1 suppressor of cytokine signaling 6 isoform X1 [Microplitis mediator]XP_057321739.1 suppressor of cytokine signaling 6 isoform X1 [Microplitis mediator]
MDEKKSISLLKSIKKKLSLRNLYKFKKKRIVKDPHELDVGTSSIDLNEINSLNHERFVGVKDDCLSLADSVDLKCSEHNQRSEHDIDYENQRYIAHCNIEIMCNSKESSNVNTNDINVDIKNYIEGDNLNNDFDVKCIDGESSQSTLSQELLKLSKYGWYWGPMSGEQADAQLLSEPDGAFLIRDSSDDRHLLTLSFKSAGKLLHARVEHSGGMFSLCNQGESGRFSSIPALIDHSMNFSKYSVFCYSRPRHPGHPAFPVRLTKPVSRFTQVRSLQYLCRFVIRQKTRRDNIHKLPLPEAIKRYVEEDYY